MSFLWVNRNSHSFKCNLKDLNHFANSIRAWLPVSNFCKYTHLYFMLRHRRSIIWIYPMLWVRNCRPWLLIDRRQPHLAYQASNSTAANGMAEMDKMVSHLAAAEEWRFHELFID